jgi:dienelactone hydrolase
MDEGKKEEPIRNSVSIPLSNLTRSFTLQGYLTIPEEPKGIVLFSHGSGSGRNSPRNNYVARALNKDGLATLLVDLLTSEEEQTDISTERLRDKIPGVVLNRFNIALLTDRLISMTDWILQNPDTKRLPLGYFGASTGTAAAIAATTKVPSQVIGAIVSRSGRPDLAGASNLKLVTAPTLFLVGGNDSPYVIKWNKNALQDISSEKKKLVTIANATHLFEEPGTLEEVARLASGWFRCFFLESVHRTS